MDQASKREDRTEPRLGTLGDVLHAGPPREPVSEADWVALVRSVGKGDQRALQALYERAHRIVFTLSFRLTKNRQTSEEVTLDVFHDVWRRAATFDPENGTVVGWIMNQARSRAIDRQRFEHRSKRDFGRADVAQTGAVQRESHEQLDVADQGRLLRSAVAQLADAERQAIEIAYFGGLSYVETAVQLRIPLSTAKTRMRSGLEKLRQALGQARSV